MFMVLVLIIFNVEMDLFDIYSEFSASEAVVAKLAYGARSW